MPRRPSVSTRSTLSSKFAEAVAANSAPSGVYLRAPFREAGPADREGDLDPCLYPFEGRVDFLIGILHVAFRVAVCPSAQWSECVRGSRDVRSSVGRPARFLGDLCQRVRSLNSVALFL